MATDRALSYPWPATQTPAASRAHGDRRAHLPTYAKLATFARLARELAALRRAQPGASITGPHALCREDDGTLVLDGGRLGDPRGAAALPYTAPEALLDPTSGGRETAAVYSLAAVLHQDLTGAPPFPGRNATEIVDRVLAGAPPRAPDGAGLPRAVESYLVDSLALDPESRPASLEQFAVGLEALAAGDHVRAGPQHQRTPGPGLSLRSAGFLALGLVAIVATVGAALDRSRARAELIGQLQEVAEARPFPLYGEDPASVAAARERLADLAPETTPSDPGVSLALGWVRLRADDLDGARGAFEHVTTHDPTGVAGWVSLGIARLEAGEERGARDLRLGLARTPRSVRDWRLRGAGCLYLHRFADAAEAFRHVTEAQPAAFSGWLHLALAEHLARDDAAAGAAVEMAQRLRPGDLWVTWLRAEHALATGERETAWQLLEDAKARLVGAPPLALRCGSLLWRSGRTREGEQWLMSAFRDAPAGERRVRLVPRGRLEFPRRADLFYGPPPLDVVDVPLPDDPFNATTPD